MSRTNFCERKEMLLNAELLEVLSIENSKHFVENISSYLLWLLSQNGLLLCSGLLGFTVFFFVLSIALVIVYYILYARGVSHFNMFMYSMCYLSKNLIVVGDKIVLNICQEFVHNFVFFH